jgi:hypothetical protein
MADQPTRADEISPERDLGEPEDTIAGPEGTDAPYPDEDPAPDEEGSR